MPSVTGVLELIEKTNVKGTTYYSVRVGGAYVGNAYKSVVKDFKSGDTVRAIFEEKGNFKNCNALEKSDGTSDVQDQSPPVEIPWPKGFCPHPVMVNEKAFYLAQLFVNAAEENKKMTKKSLMTKVSNAFELAKPIREFLLEGTTPEGTVELTDED